MSWGVSIPACQVQHFIAHIHQHVHPEEIAESITDLDARPATASQVHQAIFAAAAIVHSGAVGGPEAVVGCSLGGHANPHHQPREGFGHDTITVSVWQERGG